MAKYDLVIRNGSVVTATDTMRCDIAIRDGVIVALAQELTDATRVIDAEGKLVLPGGVESHCHVEQMSAAGIMCADDFYSASVAAAHGGTTTIIPFAAQHRGQSLRQIVAAYHECAKPKAVIDYAFHMIVSDPTEQVLGQELPALIKDGYTSFKVYTTYDLLKIDDYQFLDILALARREGAMVMVHDNVGYTPYEGRRVTGWPVSVINRGRVVVEAGELMVERESGTFLPRDAAQAARPLGRTQPELDPERNFGAHLLG